MPRVNDLTIGGGLSTTDRVLVLQSGVVITAPFNLLPYNRRVFGILIDGGGSAIATGIKGDLLIPVAGTITKWTLLADQIGSIVIDVWKSTYTNYPPTVSDTITGSEIPTLSSAIKSQDISLLTWNRTVNASDVFRFKVVSVLTVTRVTIEIEMEL